MGMNNYSTVAAEPDSKRKQSSKGNLGPSHVGDRVGGNVISVSETIGKEPSGPPHGNTLGRHAERGFFFANRVVWKAAPHPIRQTALFRNYGQLIHRLASSRKAPFPSEFTSFMRNRPQLEMICECISKSFFPTPVRIAVIGCNVGAEVFSLKWLLSERVGIPVDIVGFDTSEEVLGVCREGQFSYMDPVLDRLSMSDMTGLFDSSGEHVIVKESIRNGIVWKRCDLGDPNLFAEIGPQHVVIANNALIHMSDDHAKMGLHTMAGILENGGYLCVSGVNLDVKARTLQGLGFNPEVSGIRAIHHGYPPMLDEWPVNYWGLEPYDPHHWDHDFRYATLFRSSVGLDLPTG